MLIVLFLRVVRREMNPSRQYVPELTLEEKLRFEQAAILSMTACFVIPVTINYFSSLAVMESFISTHIFLRHFPMILA